MSNTISLSELPADNGDLYLIALADGADMGIGTADEIRNLASEGLYDDTVRLTLVTPEIRRELLAA